MSVLRLEMLPAAQGDALLLEWGTGRSRHRMLVDAGPARTYRTVHDRIQALGRRPTLDLMVVTHIDGDHLEGVVRLLLDRKALGLTVEDTWFNGWPQIEDPDSDVQGPDQGEMVGAVLDRDRLKWNEAVAGTALLLPDGDEPPPVIPLPGDARVTVLGPGPAQLATLRKKWVKVLKRVGVTPGTRGRRWSGWPAGPTWPASPTCRAAMPSWTAARPTGPASVCSSSTPAGRCC